MLSSSSPFQQHLGTNYAPTDDEIEQIQTLVSSALPGLSQLSAEVEAASQILASLKKKQDDYISFLDRHRALLAPIRRLPFDVIYTIFKFCLPSGRNAIMSPIQAPMLLLQVCRQWRDLVVNHMPLLWSSLYIPIPQFRSSSGRGWGTGWGDGWGTPGSEQEPRAEEQALFNAERQAWTSRMDHRKSIVATWLDRAKGSNLSISIYVQGSHRIVQESDGSDEEDLKAILAIVRRYTSQWVAIELATPEPIVAAILSIPASEAPRLRHLKIDHHRSTSPWPAQANLDVGRQPSICLPGGLVSCSTLQSLCLKCIPQNLRNIPVKWSNLTELYFSQRSTRAFSAVQFEPSHAMDILEQCPNLVRCGLAVTCVSAPPSTPPYPPYPLPLPNLAHHTIPNPPLHPQPPPDLFISPGQPTARLITMPFLQHFALYDIFSGNISLVQSLQMPALTSVAYATSMITTHTESPLLVLLQNWGHNIKTLAFDYHSFSESQLREFLKLTSNVEVLSLSLESTSPIGLRPPSRIHHYVGGGHPPQIPQPAYFDNKMLDDMTPKGDADKVLCPRLTSFSITLRAAEFSEEKLLEFIRARRQSNSVGNVTKLRSVRVQFATKEPKRAKERKRPTWLHRRDNKDEWPLLSTLTEDPSVDIGGLSTNIRWTHYSGGWGHEWGIHAEDDSAEIPWNPMFGLQQTPDFVTDRFRFA